MNGFSRGIATLGAAFALGASALAATPAQQASAMAAMHHDDAPVASPATLLAPAPGTVDGAEVRYGTQGGKPLKGYLVKPTAGGGAGTPGVLVFHEWWGLNDNIRRMADRLAAQGYLVLAVDMYGGQSASTPDAAQGLMKAALSEMPAADANIQAAYGYLKNSVKAGKTGTLGWCFGGSMSFEAAQVLGPRSQATVIYYGFVNGDKDQLARIKAPVLALFGGQDDGIPVSTVLAFQHGLEAQGQQPIVHVYEDASHAFANPSGKNYNKDDAEDAWKLTLEFFGKNLKG
jgi:carboxymethylenebutenolidase